MRGGYSGLLRGRCREYLRVRRPIDLKQTDALQLVALAAAILALGAAYWMVRDQDRRRAEARLAAEKTAQSARRG